MDFAIKVCHDSNMIKNSSTDFKSNNNLDENSNLSHQPSKTGTNFQINRQQKFESNPNSKHRLKSINFKQQKNCCANKTITQYTKNEVLENQHSIESNPIENNTWTQLKEFLFTSDEHPCCSDDSNVQIKCCTSLNLYYFTPKFLEEFENPIPQKVWQSISSHIDSKYKHHFTQSNIKNTETIDRSDQLVPSIEDISSNFCVWII